VHTAGLFAILRARKFCKNEVRRMLQTIMRFFLFFVLLSFSSVYAQGELKFQGFDGGYLEFGEIKLGSYEFTLKVDYPPYHLEYKGLVNAGAGTSELPYIKEDLVVVLGYWDNPIELDGKQRQFTFDKVMMFMEDEPLTVKEGEFSVLSPWDVKSTVKKAQGQSAGFRTEYEKKDEEARMYGEEDMLINALADPWNKEIKEMEKQAELDAIKKRYDDSVAAVRAMEQRRADSLAAIEAAKKRKADSLAYVENQRKLAKKRQEQQRLAEKKRKEAEKQRKAELKRRQEEERQAKAAAKKKRVKKKKKVVRKAEPQVAQADDGSVKKKVVRKRVKKKKQSASAAAADAKRTGKYKKHAMWVGAGAGVALIYSLMERSDMNKALDAYNLALASSAAELDPTMKENWDAEAAIQLEAKNKHESNFQTAFVLAVLGGGASFVLYRW
jgi:hypothetical protein